MTSSERIDVTRGTRMALRLLPIVFCCISLAAGARAAESLQCTEPVPAAPVAATPTGSEQPKASPSEKIVVDPTQLDIKVYSADDTATVTIQNSTATAVDELRFSSLGLLDGKAGGRIPAWNWGVKLGASLKPNERTDCTFRMPTSNDAGAFTGIMRVQGGGHDVSVPLTLRMRGPYLPYWNGFPLLLLTAVFLCGWSLSLWLDNWYTNRLPRVQQVLLLREQQEALNNFLSELTTWEKNGNGKVSRAVGTATFDKSDVETTLKRVNSIDLVSLQQAVQRFDSACRLNDEFWTALQIAKQTLPNNLPQISTQLDLVVRGTDPNLYRPALLQVLTTPIMTMATAAVAPGLVVSSGGADLSKATSAGLHRRVFAMDALKACVLAVVVWITAFTVYYYPNPSFGSVIDYLTLFIWALGLTTTGAQLMGSVRRP
jgi:hypothetical protein